MNRRIISFVLSILISWMILGLDRSNAQTIKPKYGKDSVNCVTNLSYYREFYKQKKYREAISPWRYVYSNCPGATENIFINGANMYNSFISIQKDSTVKKNLIDTLMLIYDKRIRYYGNEGKNLANKASDLLNADSTRAYEAYSFLKRSIDLLKNKSEESTLINYCVSALSLFRSGKISNEAIIDLYNQTELIIESHLVKPLATTDSLNWSKTRMLIETNTFSILQCKDLDTIFSKKLEAKPDDLALLKKISGILYRKGCSDDSLYLYSLEKTNILEPGVNTSFLIAREYIKRKDVARAVASLTDVADKLKDDASKAQCFYFLGVIYADSKDFINAGTNALKAVKIKSDFGDAYILIAQCYAHSDSVCGNDDLNHRAVFWCAVDKLNQAKKVQPKLSSKVNDLIKEYSLYFPTREMILSKGIKIGTKYQVGCWINETTRVRLNKGK